MGTSLTSAAVTSLTRTPGQIGTYLGVSGVQIRASDALYCGLADWYTDSSKLPELDQSLNHLQWRQSPLEDLQALLATFAVQTLLDAPLASLRPLIDEVFAHNSVPEIVAHLRAVTAPQHRE